MDLSPAVAENNRLLVEERRINKSLERELAQSDLRMKKLCRPSIYRKLPEDQFFKVAR